MSITPAKGYIIDPTNSNAVIKDPGVGYDPFASTQSIAYGAVNTPQIPTTLNSSNLSSNGAISLPPPPQNNTNYAGILTGGNAQVLANQQAMQALGIQNAPGVGSGDVSASRPGEVTNASSTTGDTGTKSTMDYIKSYIDSLTGITPPSVSDQYQSTYGVSPEQAKINADQAQSDYNAKAKTVSDINGEIQGYNAQLQGLTIGANTQNLGLQNEGAAITANGVSNSSQANVREAAIKALPIQYQALNAQARLASAQGNEQQAQQLLTQANDKLDTLFKAQVTDAQNQYQYKTNLIDKAYAYADKKEQQQLDAQKATLATNNSQYNNFVNDVRTIAGSATTNGQGALASQLASLVSNLDPNSKTFTQDYQKAQATLATLQGQIQAKPALNAGIVGEYQYAVSQGYKGSFTQYQNEDSNRKASVAAAGAGILPPTSQDTSNPQTVKDLTTVNNINNVLANPDFASAFGAKGLINQYIPGSAAQKVIADVQQIKDILSLAARGQLKGQGQISDFEGRMLANAQTALNSNLSADDAKQALANVRGAIITSSGGSTNVAITDPKTGETKIGQASSATITQAIANGYRVTYQQ